MIKRLKKYLKPMSNNLLQIDKSILREYGVSVTSYLFMMILMYYPGTKININLTQILEYGFIMENDVGYFLTEDGLSFINEVKCISVDKKVSNKDIELLAEQMRLMFPEGKKQGTTKYWRDNKANVENKLKTFFKKYGHYDSGLILKATQKYIDSFGDNKQLMRTVIYFILRDDSSDLMTIIENIDEVKSDSQNELWTTKLM